MAQFKADAESLKADLSRIRGKIRTGYESRPVRVFSTVDPETRKKTYWREDNQQFVKEVDAVDSDFEQDLPMPGLPPAKSAPAAEEKPAKKATTKAKAGATDGTDVQHPPGGFLLVKDGNVQLGDMIYDVTSGWQPMAVHQEDEHVKSFPGVARKAHAGRTEEAEAKVGQTNVGDKLGNVASLKAAPEIAMSLTVGYAKSAQVIREARKCMTSAKWDATQIDTMIEVLKFKDGDIPAMLAALEPHVKAAE